MGGWKGLSAAVGMRDEDGGSVLSRQREVRSGNVIGEGAERVLYRSDVHVRGPGGVR